MATLIHPTKDAREVEVPLTLTALQCYVGGFIYFIELANGEILIVNEASFDQFGFYNKEASKIAGQAGPIYGDAVLCKPEDIA